MNICRNGHTAPRNEKTGTCTACRREQRQRHNKTPAAKARQVLHYERNKAAIKARAIADAPRRIARNKDYVRGLKAQPCTDCGGKFHTDVMEFDHRPGTIKRCNVSQLMHRTLKGLAAEIAKCDLVCANCHRMRTFRRRVVDNDPLLL